MVLRRNRKHTAKLLRRSSKQCFALRAGKRRKKRRQGGAIRVCHRKRERVFAEQHKPDGVLQRVLAQVYNQLLIECTDPQQNAAHRPRLEPAEYVIFQQQLPQPRDGVLDAEGALRHRRHELIVDTAGRLRREKVNIVVGKAVFYALHGVRKGAAWYFRQREHGFVPKLPGEVHALEHHGFSVLKRGGDIAIKQIALRFAGVIHVLAQQKAHGGEQPPGVFLRNGGAFSVCELLRGGGEKLPELFLQRKLLIRRKHGALSE